MAKDVVCGMDVEEKTAAAKSEHKGTTYYFCSAGCKKAFDKEPEIILVHDAVRPFVTAEVINKVVEESEKYGAAVVGVRVKDTVKLGEEGFYKKNLDRNKLWAVQTPQGFRFEILKRAHIAAQRTAFLGTDEASLVERLRIPVKIVEGDYRNIKITTDDDLKLAEMLLG